MVESKNTRPMVLETLDRDSFVPLYHQLYEILRSYIDSGIWKQGDMIPSESQLKKRFDVSQITVRQSLNILVEKGLIYRQRGKGTFVSRSLLTSNLTHIVNFADDMRQRGLKPHTEFLDSGINTVSKDTAQKFHMNIGDEIARINRLRYADDEPLSIEKTFLNHAQVPGILKNDFSKRSLSETLLTDYGIQIAYAKQTISAQSASEEHAELLNITVGDPLLVIRCICYLDDGTPVEMLSIFYRADRYALDCELKGEID